MACDVLDLQCIFVSELAGSIVVAVIAFLIAYFIIAAKLNWGFNTTVGFLAPFIFIASLAIGGFTAVIAFATIFIGIVAAGVFNEIIKNR